MYEVGDLVMVRGRSWISKLISFATRGRIGPFLKEGKTWATHVEVVVEPGNVFDAKVISADRTGINVRTLKPKERIIVYRYNRMDRAVRDNIVGRSRGIEGAKYPVLRLVAHLLDAALLDVYLFRRIFRKRRSFVCSELAVWLFTPYAVFPFQEYYATPDDIWDFVTTSPEWDMVASLEVPS